MNDIALRIYNMGWRLAIPFLKMEPRLRDGYSARLFIERPRNHADIWIQAASAGESYLALSLIKALPADRNLNILVSTNTRQGMDILEKAGDGSDGHGPGINLELMFFPFDRPSIMDAAVRRINPGVMVLLESELWPGLLFALRRYNRKILVINGRMTTKSLKRYRMFPGLWKKVAPDRVLAISRGDGERFADLFGWEKTEIMSNIKFDSISVGYSSDEKANQVRQLLPQDVDFLVFGSIRQEEEKYILKIIEMIGARLPRLVIGLFPRHMHRLNAWKRLLEKTGKNWTCRTALTTSPAKPGMILLWDTFGELNAAYAEARAVFVGGSLAPLGGQNFLEPLKFRLGRSGLVLRGPCSQNSGLANGGGGIDRAA